MPINKVIFGDCMDYLPLEKPLKYNIAIVDPPYGINAEHGTNRASRKQFKERAIGWDSGIPDATYFEQLKRVSKNQIIWGGNYYLDYLGNTQCMLVWDKLNPDRNFADCELAWTSFKKVARIFNGSGKRVQELNKLDGGKIHPTQKPVSLYHWQMSNYCEQGDIILDTHVGSGSSRIAAAILGLDFIGYEKDEHYYNEQEKRYQEFLQKYSLMFGILNNGINKVQKIFKLD